jgi:hypothetical protein
MLAAGESGLTLMNSVTTLFVGTDNTNTLDLTLSGSITGPGALL